MRAAAGPADSLDSHPTREQVLGAWHLVSIETTTHRGKVSDAFFQAGSIGLIVYEASGWMSVQISAPHRVPPHSNPLKVPESRSSATLDSHLRLKAAAFDSYYAYYGTWHYEATSGVMTHHVTSSLIPAEAGLDYSQVISMDGNRMTFTGHWRLHGREFTRIKVWARVDRP